MVCYGISGVVNSIPNNLIVVTNREQRILQRQAASNINRSTVGFTFFA